MLEETAASAQTKHTHTVDDNEWRRLTDWHLSAPKPGNPLFFGKEHPSQRTSEIRLKKHRTAHQDQTEPTKDAELPPTMLWVVGWILWCGFPFVGSTRERSVSSVDAADAEAAGINRGGKEEKNSPRAKWGKNSLASHIVSPSADSRRPRALYQIMLFCGGMGLMSKEKIPALLSEWGSGLSRRDLQLC